MALRARRSGSQMNGGGQPPLSTRDPAIARKCVSQASDHQTRPVAGRQPTDELHTRATFEIKKHETSLEPRCIAQQTSPTPDLKDVMSKVLMDRAVQLSPNPVFEPAQRDLPLVVTEVQTDQVASVMRSMQTSPEPLPPTPVPVAQPSKGKVSPQSRAPSGGRRKIELVERELQTSPFLIQVQPVNTSAARTLSPSAMSHIEIEKMDMEERGRDQDHLWSGPGPEVALLKPVNSESGPERGPCSAVEPPKVKSQAPTPRLEPTSTKATPAPTPMPTPRVVPVVKGGGCIPFWRKSKVHDVLEAPQEEAVGAGPATPVAPSPLPLLETTATLKQKAAAFTPAPAKQQPKKAPARGISMSTSFLDGNIVAAAIQTEAPDTAETAIQTAKVHRRPKEATEDSVDAKKSPKKQHRGAKVDPVAVSRETTDAELLPPPKEAAPIESAAHPKQSSRVSKLLAVGILQPGQEAAVAAGEMPGAASSPAPPHLQRRASASSISAKPKPEADAVVESVPVVEPLELPSSRAPTAAASEHDTTAPPSSVRAEEFLQSSAASVAVAKKPSFWQRIRTSFRSSRAASKIEPPPAEEDELKNTVDRSAQVSRLDDTEGQLLRVEGKLDRILDVGSKQTNKLDHIDAQITNLGLQAIETRERTTFAMERSGEAGELDFLVQERTVRSARARVFGARHPFLGRVDPSMGAEQTKMSGPRGHREHKEEPPLVLESVRSREITLTSTAAERSGVDETDAQAPGSTKAGSKKGSAATVKKVGKEKSSVPSALAIATDGKSKGSAAKRSKPELLLSRESTDCSNRKSALLAAVEPTHVSSAKSSTGGGGGSAKSGASASGAAGNLCVEEGDGAGDVQEIEDFDECEVSLSESGSEATGDERGTCESRTSDRAQVIENSGLPSANARAGCCARRDPKPVEVTRCSKTCSIM